MTLKVVPILGEPLLSNFLFIVDMQLFRMQFLLVGSGLSIMLSMVHIHNYKNSGSYVLIY